MSTPSRTRRTYRPPTPAAVLHKEPKPIVIELQGDTLSFRHHGERKRYTLTAAEAFREATLRAASDL